MAMHSTIRALMPDMWVRNMRTDREWDAVLRAYLDNGAPVEIESEFRARVGNVRVWIANWPYAYGHAEGRWGERLSGLPSRRTAARLHAAISEQVAAHRIASEEERREKLRAALVGDVR